MLKKVDKYEELDQFFSKILGEKERIWYSLNNFFQKRKIIIFCSSNNDHESLQSTLYYTKTYLGKEMKSILASIPIKNNSFIQEILLTNDTRIISKM